MKFNSQICTTREQSERLLSLGLKKETADCCYLWRWESDSHFLYANSWEDIHISTSDIPAWSLHRLWELDQIHYIILDSEYEIATLYDEVINNIDAQIKEGVFNKEYLEE